MYENYSIQLMCGVVRYRFNRYTLVAIFASRTHTLTHHTCSGTHAFRPIHTFAFTHANRSAFIQPHIHHRVVADLLVLLLTERETAAAAAGANGRIAQRRRIAGGRRRTLELLGGQAREQDADALDQGEQHAADDGAAGHGRNACRDGQKNET